MGTGRNIATSSWKTVAVAVGVAVMTEVPKIAVMTEVPKIGVPNITVAIVTVAIATVPDIATDPRNKSLLLLLLLLPNSPEAPSLPRPLPLPHRVEVVIAALKVEALLEKVVIWNSSDHNPTLPLLIRKRQVPLHLPLPLLRKRQMLFPYPSRYP